MLEGLSRGNKNRVEDALVVNVFRDFARFVLDGRQLTPVASVPSMLLILLEPGDMAFSIGKMRCRAILKSFVGRLSTISGRLLRPPPVQSIPPAGYFNSCNQVCC
jgi:hypothetical protein